MSAMTAEGLSAAVQAAEAAIEEARVACYAAQRMAEGIRNAAQAPHHATMDRLKVAYQDRALELAIEANKCPRERWGGYMDPHDVRVRDAGLWLTWDINGNYAPESFLATWDALLASAPATENNE